MSQAPSRRRFLQVGALGALLLGLFGVAGADLSRRGALTAGRALGERELQALSAIAARICPGGPCPNGPALPGASEIGLAEQVHDFLQAADPQVQSDVAGLLRLFASPWGGLLMDGRFSAFTALTSEAQDQVLDQWRRSRLGLKRGAFAALRGLLISRYWADSRIYGASGYPGPPNYGQGRTP